MELVINNKIFNGTFNDNVKSINIPLTEKEDVLYFYKYRPKPNQYNKKSDYTQDIDFRKITEHGTLFSCWFVLSQNEDYVTIYYDYYKTINNLDI